jgi:hypothetical protein
MQGAMDNALRAVGIVMMGLGILGFLGGLVYMVFTGIADIRHW